MRSPRRSRLRWSGLSLVNEERAGVSPSGTPGPESRKDAPERYPWAGPCPDLLHPEPRMSIDAEALVPQLSFAFAGGDCAERILLILAEAKTSASSWDPKVFASHLFVESWVEHLVALPLGGRALDADRVSLKRLLTHPPDSAEERSFRHEVLEELIASPAAETELLELYRELRHLRALLLRAPPEGPHEGTRRRIEVLASIRAVLERAASGFEGTRSGLKRLRELAQEVVASEEFARVKDLLDHDRHRAMVSLSLRLGGDGRVRALTIAKIEEDTSNRFHRTAPRRFWTKVLLWLRGYRFAEEEVVDRWIDAVWAGVDDLVPGFLQLIAHLEFYLVALAFRQRSAERGLPVCLPVLDDRDQGLEGLFNPLLLAQGVAPVPCDLSRPGAGSSTIITGPNSGGKTRLLQSIGLAQLLAQAGFFVPARRARMRAVPYLFCSLVQEDTFDQSEGRLGTELLRIRRMFERAPPGSLIIIDELCSGTNPSEGEEIFMLVISLFDELQPETFVTTHFLDFAHRLQARAGALRLEFLRVELDEAQHPTFGFVPGVAPTSLAAQAASRLGVTRDELLSLVRRHKT